MYLLGIMLSALVAPGSDQAPTSLAADAPSAAVSGSEQVTDPIWISRPTGEQLASYFPYFAMTHELSGSARIRCRITESGGLTDCEVISEQPENADFGQASLAIAQFFAMERRSRSGVPVAGRSVVVPIRWRMGGGADADSSDAAVSEARARQGGGGAARPVADSPPQWVDRPSQQAMVQALRTHAPGYFAFSARLRCELSETGQFENCRAEQLTPDDPRVAAAVVAMAASMRMRPATARGVPVRTTVVVPLRLESGMGVGSDGRPNRRR